MSPHAEQRLELTEPDAYKERVIALLAGCAPLDVLAETPDRLDAIAGSETPGVMRARPFEGKWTPQEIVGHYVDVEWAFGWRTRSIVGDDHPNVVGLDQDKWVTALRHNEGDHTALLAAFRALRTLNLAYWRTLTPDHLSRTARHEERGEEHLGLWIQLLGGHDLWHIDQLERYRAAARRC